MLFHTWTFLAFSLVLLVLLAIYRRTPPRKVILLAASCVFYMWWNPAFILLIGLSTVVDYLIGRRMETEERPGRRRLLLVGSVAFNLGVLAFFKYANFFQDNLLWVMRALGHEPGWTALNVILPVGISFYTFQTMSYTIDVYRREIPASRSPLDFALFVTFFPQLVAGPIVRARDFLPQLERPVRISLRPGDLTLILRGLAKKVLVADNLAAFADPVFAEPGSWPTPVIWLAVLAFSVQIYCDFSGYSDMAIGIARILGFRLPWNFRWPYFARNPSDFWGRWHISLSTWLRDYLYIPLGGNRRGRVVTYRNLMLTMLLGGLWHGASWNFVIWGAMHGVLLCLYRAVAPLLPRRSAPTPSRLGWTVSWISMQLLILVTWIPFRLQDAGALRVVARKFFLLDADFGLLGVGLARLGLLTTLVVLLAFSAAHAASYRYRGLHRRIAALASAWFLPICFVAGMLLYLGWPLVTQPFVYFQF